jgi:hypothetical protein
MTRSEAIEALERALPSTDDAAEIYKIIENEEPAGTPPAEILRQAAEWQLRGFRDELTEDRRAERKARDAYEAAKYNTRATTDVVIRLGDLAVGR